MQRVPRLTTETPTCATPAASTFAMHRRSSAREQRGALIKGGAFAPQRERRRLPAHDDGAPLA